MVLFISILCSLYLLLLAGKCVLAIVQSVNDAPSIGICLPDDILTVMQPILSGDARLEEMLESNLRSLPGQRFLWLCDGWDTEGLRVAEKLRGEYPSHRISIRVCSECPERVNPKVHKLIEGSAEVETPFFVVLDDDTHLPSATAVDLVERARHVMISTALPSYKNEGSFSGLLLAQFVDNNSPLTYLSLLPFIRPISINGMCYVMKASDIGMFRRISHHLTDDLALAVAVGEAGGIIHQSVLPVRLVTDITSFPHYMRMMHRWYLFALLLLRGQPIGRKLLISALHGWHPIVLWALLAAWVCHPSIGLGVVTVVFLSLRAGMLVVLQGKVFGGSFHLPLHSIVSELLQPIHLLHAAINRNIRWRSRRYRVHSSECFEPHE